MSTEPGAVHWADHAKLLRAEADELDRTGVLPRFAGTQGGDGLMAKAAKRIKTWSSPPGLDGSQRRSTTARSAALRDLRARAAQPYRRERGLLDLRKRAV